MFKLRDEHLAAFRAAATSDFERRALDHVRQYLLSATIRETDEAIVRRVRDCVPRAEKYGLTTERQIMAFVDTSYWLSKDFDSDTQQSWSRDVLTSKTFSADEKATALTRIAQRIFDARELRRMSHA